MNTLIRLIYFIRVKLNDGARDIYSLPAFAADTRSSPLQVQFELDVRNDRNLSEWSRRWRLVMFNRGIYGSRPFEETIGQPRPAAHAMQPAPAALVNDFAEGATVRPLRRARAA